MASLLRIYPRGHGSLSSSRQETDADRASGMMQHCIRLLEEELERLDPRLLPYHEKGLRRAIRLLRTQGATLSGRDFPR